MRHLFLWSVTLVSALGVAQAGQIIDIGQVSGSVNLGLTSTYVTTVTNSTIAKYNNLIFQGATNSTNPITMPVGTSTETSTAQVTDSSNDPNADGAVTFALIGGNSAGTANGWYNNGTGAASVYIPVGVFDVDTAWTMLNDIAGSAVQLTFSFNTTNSLTGATNVVLNLADGTDIRNGVLCGTPGVTSGCPSTAAVTLTGSTPTPVAATNLPNGKTTINVTTGSINYPNYSGATNTVWNPSYNTAIASGNPDAGSSSGNLTLDDQAYQFGNLFYGDYLVGITVNQAAPSGAVGHFDLSAVSVDNGATPEPASVVMFGSGLVALAGFMFMRRKKQEQN